MKKLLLILCSILLVFGIAGMASATPFSIMIGDNDGYGQGIPDNGNASWASTVPQDWRSATEQTATDGSQGSDLYGILYASGFTDPFDVIFNLPGWITTATLTIDVADLQRMGGTVQAMFNGILEPGLLDIDQGFQTTGVYSWALDAAAIANANTASQFVLNLAPPSFFGDYIAFDFFQLEGEFSSVPEPATMLLLGSGLIGLGVFGRKKLFKKS